MKKTTMVAVVASLLFVITNIALAQDEGFRISSSPKPTPKADLKAVNSEVKDLQNGNRSYQDSINNAQTEKSAAQARAAQLQSSLGAATGENKDDVKRQLDEQNARIKASDDKVKEMRGNIADNNAAISKREAQIPSLTKQAADENASSVKAVAQQQQVEAYKASKPTTGYIAVPVAKPVTVAPPKNSTSYPTVYHGPSKNP